MGEESADDRDHEDVCEEEGEDAFGGEFGEEEELGDVGAGAGAGDGEGDDGAEFDAGGGECVGDGHEQRGVEVERCAEGGGDWYREEVVVAGELGDHFRCDVGFDEYADGECESVEVVEAAGDRPVFLNLTDDA